MQMNIRTLNLDASPSLDDHAFERVMTALSHFAERVGAVDVRLEDVHGQRHGQDMRCTLRVHIEGAGVVMIEQVEADIYDAIDAAAHRLKRVVHRKVGRSRGFAHERHSDQRRAA
ncbi:MAG: HPF/RaiA family ribosome-associated protein [Phycisphaerales bacterium JB063]